AVLDFDGTLYRGQRDTAYLIVDLPFHLAEQDLFSRQALADVEAAWQRHLAAREGGRRAVAGAVDPARTSFAGEIIDAWCRGTAGYSPARIGRACRAYWAANAGDDLYPFARPLVAALGGHVHTI